MRWLRNDRRRVRPPRVALALVLLMLIVLAARYRGEPAPNVAAPAGEAVRIERVVDGDTLLLADRTRVRLIGVNTPETVKPDTPPQPWGAEASEFTKKFLQGREPRLEYDDERLDQHGRTLAYVWVDDRMLNEELLRAGLARAEMHFHYSSTKKDRFRKAQQEAKQARLGLWSGQAPAR